MSKRRKKREVFEIADFPDSIEYRPNYKGGVCHDCEEHTIHEYKEEGVIVEGVQRKIIDKPPRGPTPPRCPSCGKKFKSAEAAKYVRESRKGKKRAKRKAKIKQTSSGRKTDCLHYIKCRDKNLHNDLWGCPDNCTDYEYDPEWRNK